MYKIGRRNFLYASAFGLSSLSGLAKEVKQEKSVILIWLHGGMSDVGTFNILPDAADKVRGSIKGIHTTVPGLYISEFLPKTAQNTDKLTILRNASNYNGSHGIADSIIMSGKKYIPGTFYPTYGSIIAKELGHKTQIPPFVQIGNSLDRQTAQGGTGGHLGSKYNPFKLDDDPNSPNFKIDGITLPDGVNSSRLQERFNMAKSLNRNIGVGENIIAMDKYYDKALSLVLNRSTERVFKLDNESPKTRDQYGRNTFGQSCLMARRLVEAGCRFVTVTDGGWDTHVDNDKALAYKLPILDAGYASLLADLAQRGMLDNTIVMIHTDFGRTNMNATNGRDHKAGPTTMVVSGGGFKHLGSIGKTDNRAEHVIDQPIYIEDVAQTMYKLIGIDTHKEYIANDGRPFTIHKDGRVLNEII